MKSAGFSNVDEWNAAGSYFDTLNILNNMYYRAKFSTGSQTDDLEAFKSLLDHCSCKFRREGIKFDLLNVYWKETDGGKKSLLAWFDDSVEEVEKYILDYEKRRMQGTLNDKAYDTLTLAKKKLRNMHRELMFIMELLNCFRINRNFNKHDDFFNDLGGSVAKRKGGM